MKLLYPHTKVTLIRPGECRVTFHNGENVLSIKNEILKPILDKVGIPDYMVDNNHVINTIAHYFTNFNKNIKNGINGYLTIHGDYEKGITSTSTELKYIEPENLMVNDLIISGGNGKEKLKNVIVNINDKLNEVISKITSHCEFIKISMITEDDINEYNK